MVIIFSAMIDTPEEKDKFKCLYEKYNRLMFYAANEILKNESLAEEAVQEALARIAKNIEKVDEAESDRTKRFALVIVENAAKSIYRKEHKIRDALEYSDEVNHTHCIDSTTQFAEANDLVEAILELPQKQRQILYLYEIYGYNYREIANLMNMTGTAVRKQVQRAKETLKQDDWR